MKLTDADRDAFERAIAILRGGTDADRAQIDGMLEERGFVSAGKFAAYSCQVTALKPPPWAPVPASDDIREGWEDYLEAGDDGVMGRYSAAQLLRKMLAAGLSAFEPNPLGALRAAAAETKTRAAVVAPPLQ